LGIYPDFRRYLVQKAVKNRTQMKTEIEITPLLSHIEQFVNINFSSDDVNLLDEIITVQKFQKGNILLRENEVSSKSFFIINGLIRLYYNINGAEKTAYFYTENQFVTAFESYTKRNLLHIILNV
jgi:CRP-like cAMP-binding protein